MLKKLADDRKLFSRLGAVPPSTSVASPAAVASTRLILEELATEMRGYPLAMAQRTLAQRANVGLQIAAQRSAVLEQVLATHVEYVRGWLEGVETDSEGDESGGEEGAAAAGEGGSEGEG